MHTLNDILFLLDTQIKANGTGEITGPILNSHLKRIVNSVYPYPDERVSFNFSEWFPTSQVTPGTFWIRNSRIYRAIQYSGPGTMNGVRDPDDTFGFYEEIPPSGFIHAQNTDFKLGRHEKTYHNIFEGVPPDDYSGRILRLAVSSIDFQYVNILRFTADQGALGGDIYIQTFDNFPGVVNFEHTFLVYVDGSCPPNYSLTFISGHEQDVGDSPLILRRGDWALFLGASPWTNNTVLLSTKLGTAAVANVQVTHTDIIAGRVLTVGAFGLSIQALSRMGGNMNTVVQSGLYYCEAMSNAPAAEDIILRVHRAFSTYIIQTAYSTTQPAIWTRAMLAGAWTAWRRVITDGNIATHALDGLMTAEDKVKLDGIPVGGGAYVHPDTHPASIIEQTVDFMFTTLAEKNYWNEKLDRSEVVSTPTPDKVLRLTSNSQFPASIIEQTVDFMFTTLAEKNYWSGKFGEPIEVTGTVIDFTTSLIFNTASAPGAWHITHDLVNARLGIVQKIYHLAGGVPTFPASWVKLTGEYKVNVLNIIYAEWCGGTRVEYWIIS